MGHRREKGGEAHFFGSPGPGCLPSAGRHVNKQSQHTTVRLLQNKQTNKQAQGRRDVFSSWLKCKTTLQFRAEGAEQEVWTENKQPWIWFLDHIGW